MPRSRPSTDPISFHKPTGQYYVTRGGKRVYLGADQTAALERYHRTQLGLETASSAKQAVVGPIPLKELANRFVATQRANWRSPERTFKCYLDWLGRFLKDHPKLDAMDFTVERFAAWKLSLRQRGYAAESINHYLNAVRAIFKFAEDTDLLTAVPRLSRVRNETRERPDAARRPLYTAEHVQALLGGATAQMRLMILLGLNCGFGPKDLEDLTWRHFGGEYVTLPRSKTGVRQTFQLWPQTREALEATRTGRSALIRRLAKRGRERSDNGHVFSTRAWKQWNKDAVAVQFRRLCARVGVPCYGFYRLRHCASTAMASVAMPHVHRRFMRHSQLQQQVTYTHTSDREVDEAVMRAKEKFFPEATAGQEKNLRPAEAV